MSNSDSQPPASSASADADRRQFVRRSFGSLSYVQLDETNGGILLNVSEGGLAVHAAMSVMEDVLEQIRLQPPHSRMRLETTGRIAWNSDSRRMVGIQFEKPSEEFSAQLREWLVAEVAAAVGTRLAAAAVTQLDPKEQPIVRPALPRNLRALATSAAPAVEQRRSQVHPTELLEGSPKTRAAATAPLPASRVARKPKTSDTHGYVGALVLLAALSLLAGWETGRGSLLSELFHPSSAAAESPTSAASRAVANSAFTNFLVIDASNQSWLVPFAGATDVAKVPPSPALPPQTPAARAASEAAVQASPPPTYPVGALYSPRTSLRANASGAGAAAPALPEAQSSPALSGALSAPAPINIVPPPEQPPSSSLIPATVIQRVDPIYPRNALDQRIDGSVKLQVSISTQGTVTGVKTLSGSSLLAPAAINAVRLWRYKPEILDGRPVSSNIDLTVQFKLPQQ